MGGDDSQKLLPWRGIYFSPGPQTSGSNTKSTLYLNAISSVLLTSAATAIILALNV